MVNSKKNKKKPIRRSAKAGLDLSIAKIEKTLKEVVKKSDIIPGYMLGKIRVSEGGAIYLAGVIEHLAITILELSCQNVKKKTITIDTIVTAIQSEPSLNAYIYGNNCSEEKTSTGMCPCGISKIPKEIGKKITTSDIKTLSHDDFLNYDKSRIISETDFRRIIKKTVHQKYNLQIRQNAVEYLIILIQNIADMLSNHAINATLTLRNVTITTKPIQMGVKNSIPESLSKTCVEKATIATTRYSSY